MLAAGCMPASDRGGKSTAEPPDPSQVAAPQRNLTATSDPQPSTPPERAAAQDAASTQARPGRRVRPPFDPLRDNGPIFAGWPKPRLAIVITGRQDGYLEPCGCAGLDRMRGGLSRRHTMIASLRERGWPMALFDAGGLSKRFGPQALLKLRTSVEALTEMGYDAIGLGVAELQFPATDLVTLIAGEDGLSSRFVSANVGLFGLEAQLTPRKRIVEVSGLKLGVTCILGKTFQSQIHNPDLEMTDPETALAPLVAEMRPACDWMILLAYTTRDEATALARRFPEFDIVVTSDGPPVPPPQAKRVEGGKTWLIEVGEYSRFRSESFHAANISTVSSSAFRPRWSARNRASQFS